MPPQGHKGEEVDRLVDAKGSLPNGVWGATIVLWEDHQVQEGIGTGKNAIKGGGQSMGVETPNRRFVP